MKYLVNKKNIQEYIPQHPPMVMINKIIDCNEQEIITEFEIEDGTIFVKNGCLQECGIIENMAQSAAAMTGYLAKQNQQDIKRGFIGSVKKINIKRLPKINTNILTKVKVITQVMNANVVQATVTQNKTEIANCQMNIFLEE